ncbi:stAR-related lipid transfer protein 7, mitochondrial [Platysternon megacephalum]|uniref:StAR-related lipid transfer protein 7, mitochondrial n=1 Tax=Platysternon megacephalum TaxID=55544 RepID=A0A4D9DSM4_9SAUR|nr:stAR-related lipid transfer protein 7, mitochondrial [Platysternon megacephalum]
MLFTLCTHLVRAGAWQQFRAEPGKQHRTKWCTPHTGYQTSPAVFAKPSEAFAFQGWQRLTDMAQPAHSSSGTEVWADGALHSLGQAGHETNALAHKGRWATARGASLLKRNLTSQGIQTHLERAQPC